MMVFAIAAMLLQAAQQKLPSTAVPDSDMADVIDWHGSRAQVDDAFRRWASKAGESVEQVRISWSPRLIYFPTKNCIQLWPKGPGGAPIYCYRANSIELIEEYSDTE